MTIKKISISTAMILAMGVTVPTWGQSEGTPAIGLGAADITVVDGDAVQIECLPQAELDAMTAADKEKLTLPVCEAEGATSEDASEEKSKAK